MIRKNSFFRTFLLFILCIFLSQKVRTQFDLGVLAGVNVSTFRNTKLDNNIITYQAGLIGVFGLHTFKKVQLELLPQLVWQRKGADMNEISEQNSTPVRYVNHLHSDYIQFNLPVGGKLNFSMLQPMFYFVPYIGYRVASRNKWFPEGNNLPIYIPNDIDCGVKVCLGVGVRRVRFLFAYNFGLTSVNKNHPIFYNDTFEVTLLYFFFNQFFSKK